jgi:DNA repair protein RecO (recombination protein O)
MLVKTEAIVLNFIKYKESSIIAKIYTSELGIQSYIVNGVRSKNKSKIAFFQPLTLLDLVVYKKNNASLNRIAEIHCSHPYKSIPYELKKTTIALMIAEVLLKTLREEEANQDLFLFLQKSLIILDSLEADYENFHIHFLFQLSSFHGIFPSSAKDIITSTAIILTKEEETRINQFIHSDFFTPVKIAHTVRQRLLEILFQFFNNHIENFGELKSVKILREVLH